MSNSLVSNINLESSNRLRQRVESMAVELGIVESSVNGARVFHFCEGSKGTVEAGVLLAELCLGLDGQISVREPIAGQINRPHIHVQIANPLVACMGCQYAGWPVSVGKYFAMASGPVRLLRGKEEVLGEYDLNESSTSALVVLESAKLPDEDVVNSIADESGVEPAGLSICVARTSSIPGSLQVVARSVETAMHKLHELGFDLSTVRSGDGTAPLPPDTENDLVALGWTNDAMLYGADVQLTVETTDKAIASMIQQTPSCSSDEFGSPFLELFKRYEYDFYKIDKMLFSPAKITITNLTTGNHFTAGELRGDILKASFGI